MAPKACIELVHAWVCKITAVFKRYSDIYLKNCVYIEKEKSIDLKKYKYSKRKWLFARYGRMYCRFLYIGMYDCMTITLLAQKWILYHKNICQKTIAFGIHV